MVPTVNDVKLTGAGGANPWFRGPNFTGGYQPDGRIATLQEQALGAIVNHAQALAAPTDLLLDDLASFQNVLFTSPGVRALSNAISAGETVLPDPDPPLDELEQQGKAVFKRACAQCHGGHRNPMRSRRSFGSTCVWGADDRHTDPSVIFLCGRNAGNRRLPWG
jgi:cytochrome c peroxidase